MTPEAYVAGSFILAVIVVALMYGSGPIDDAFKTDDAFKCPRCGAEMQEVSSGVGCLGIRVAVVPQILVVTCPQCGYSERS